MVLCTIKTEKNTAANYMKILSKCKMNLISDMLKYAS